MSLRAFLLNKINIYMNNIYIVLDYIKYIAIFVA